MENTGRITRTIGRTARNIVFGEVANAAIDAELPSISEVDRAHVVMLFESGLIDRPTAAAILGAVEELRGDGFKPLKGAIAPRGVYILYEDYLIRKIGIAAGGMLQLGRSRNDLNATVARMRLRATVSRLVREALRLQAVLLRRARRYAGVVMPAYTHYQAAVPITYGHYLAGAASALNRDLEALLAAASDLDICPLGAGAVGGTSLPIQGERTAALLGFTEPKANSVDAVASRDFVLRLLGAAAILGVTESRVATDLLSWTAPEYGLITLPDHLVGSSSMMPQKRNAYLLEHVQGRSAAALGAFTQAAMACHAKPFTNSISVGTEALSGAFGALDKVADTTVLLRLMIAEARPVPEVMLDKAEAGYTTATELANRMVLEGKMSFRAAHHEVGALVRRALDAGCAPLASVAQEDGAAGAVSCSGLDAAAVVSASEHGGGPGPRALKQCLDLLERDWSAHAASFRRRRDRWRSAICALDAEVKRLLPSSGADE